AHGRGALLEEIAGPDDLETLPRYRALTCRDPWTATRTILDRCGKILWVSNTVRRCMELAEETERLALAPLLYHSRFRYADRVVRHRNVIEAFDSPDPVVALTTQVAEMSLDLSADLLVTD